MSANMFKMREHHQGDTPNPSNPPTKIPVATSPLPLRRAGSVRIRGEKELSCGVNPTSKRRSVGSNQSVHDGSTSIVPPLRRGNSFTEKGTRGLGNGTRAPAVACRPRNVATEPRNRGAPKGSSTPGGDGRARSLSLSLSTTHLGLPRSPVPTVSPKTPPASPDVRHKNYKDWDTESVTSVNSGLSVASSCDHASIARNGTTFSGRSMKYVVHCNQHAGATGEDYLTPTQRAHRQVKRLKTLLQQAHKDLEQKDNDIVKLTKEVVELRLYKAALSSPEDKSNSSDAVTVRENTDEQSTPDADLVDANVANHLGADMSSSYADSGHYEDFTNSSVHSKESVVLSEEFNQTPYKHRRSAYSLNKSTSTDVEIRDFDLEHNSLITEYEKRIQELVRTHEEETHQIKQKHNDKVEELLQRITDINNRYWQLVPELECARERISELEKQLDEACKNLEEQEEKTKQESSASSSKGVEVVKVEENKVIEVVNKHPSRISVPELLQQLQVTQTELENIKDIEYATTSNNLHPLLSAKEAVSLWVLGARKAMYRQLLEAKNSRNKIDPEITLQFLKSAIYYFLTDKENSQGHLRAIQSILGFSENEINNIDKSRST